MSKPPLLLLAFDSFKESMTSLTAAAAFEKGFRQGFPGARFRTACISDGGEGFTDALLHHGHGRRVSVRVRGPLGRPVTASYGLFDKGQSAVIEMARASGLELLTPRERNPLKTSTYGTGQLIDAALKRGARRLVIGIGGSATNDGGVGMAQALGVRFYDAQGRLLPALAGGKELVRITRIDAALLARRLKGVRTVAACDVTNPMTGPRGASVVYGPQKGATPAMVQKLDAGLVNLCRLLWRDLRKNVRLLPGAGAAGGLGGGLSAFLGASLSPGIQIVLNSIGFDTLLKGVDLVITGEGRSDAQTASNKAPYGVARAAAAAKKPVLLVSGSLAPGSEKLNAAGFTACFSILPGPVPLQQAVREGAFNMTRTAEALARLLKVRNLP
ncbi:MAG: glycerate kinase [Fibrobacterota bacterium]